MKKNNFLDKLRYQFDNFMSRGTIALVGALFVVTICMILTAATILVVGRIQPEGSEESLGVAEAIWQISMRAIDAGTVAGDSGWDYRSVGILVTLGGIFITSALIGILASGLEEKLNELRRGRSRVVEAGHTVVLGWSPQVFTIVSELAHANRNLSKKRRLRTGSQTSRSACVTILADKDKIEMDEALRTKVPEMFGTHVVCRSGSPTDIDDLLIVSPETARAVIILSSDVQFPDLSIAKALMALVRNQELNSQKIHIVSAIRNPQNQEIMKMIGGTTASIFWVDRLISRLIAQTCRHPGLSTVYGELLTFEGEAIYFQEEPALIGTTYGQALLKYNGSSLIGIQYKAGEVQLNPPSETTLQAGDKIIAIAGDDDAIHLSGQESLEIDDTAIVDLGLNELASPNTEIENLLILGWNRRGPMILEQLSYYVPADSKVKVVAALEPEQMQADCAAYDFREMRVEFTSGQPTDRLILEKLTDEGYPYIIVLSSMITQDIQISDAASMVILLHLRDISKKTGQVFSVVSEIMDVRNRDLVAVTSAEDVIISERLIALALTQIAENKENIAVFVELLNPGGQEIYLKPVGDYVLTGRSVNFFTVIEAAKRRGETAIGYRLLSESSQPAESFGVHLNPDKHQPVIYSEQDRIIVLSES